MIDDVELRELSVEMGVPVGTVEKDLAMTCALNAISRRKLRDHLVFKGGTAIKKIYYPGARFSEDLDFTVVKLKEEEVKTQLESLNHAEVNSITFMEVSEEGYTHGGTRFRLPYTGPLNYRIAYASTSPSETISSLPTRRKRSYRVLARTSPPPSKSSTSKSSWLKN